MVAFATQVKRRRGTEAQNDAFTGAEGEITVDLTNMTLRVHDGVTQGGFVVGGGAGRNIGDVFFTARTDTTLNGAVEANGSQYNTTDFDGTDAIGNILSAGKVPYVAIADFDTAVANNGECTSFGWDGGTVFKVPKINGRRLIRRQLPTADNNYAWYNLYSDGWVEQGGTMTFPAAGTSMATKTITFPVAMANTNYTAQPTPIWTQPDKYYGWVLQSKTTTSMTYNGYNTTATQNLSWQVSGYAAESAYNDKSTWQYDRYMRPMVQLANGATDEAVVVAGDVLSDIADLKTLTEGMIDYVVEKQNPTSANGYTWYRKYKSGWVEQGGRALVPATNGLSGSSVNVTLPVPIATPEQATLSYNGMGSTGYYANCENQANVTTTTVSIGRWNNGSSVAEARYYNWTLSGMSAQ